MKSIVLSEQAAHATHLFFEWLAIATGVQLYRLQRKRAGAGGILQAGHYGVLIGCILGAAIGNKLVYWLEVPHLWVGHWNDPAAWAGGQSIVGGLLGGLLGVELAKFCFGVKESTGDNFVVPLAVGTAIGRIGCFLAGLHDGTYGTATALPWGIDFGDGVARHPTQLYEIAFVLALAGALTAWRRDRAVPSGLAFKAYLWTYLFWRLAVDAIKPVPYPYPLGLSGIQWICIIALAAYTPLLVRQSLQAWEAGKAPLQSGPHPQEAGDAA
ncbi:MAG TPA: prolipoprotein diacylglyceryl transferase family protein [Burkholderiaceae bacterium]